MERLDPSDVVVVQPQRRQVDLQYTATRRDLLRHRASSRALDCNELQRWRNLERSDTADRAVQPYHLVKPLKEVDSCAGDAQRGKNGVTSQERLTVVRKVSREAEME